MISVKNLTKFYGKKRVFENFNIDFEEDKITVILGESGSGKTTLLNVLANLTPFVGRVDGISDVSVVFQTDRLVPHLTVKENLALVNEKADVSAYLKETDLTGTEDLYPKDLSAGMARRVAIIRAFCYSAPVLLMDEPLVNLDLSLKYYLIDRIKRLKEREKRTVIFVTHDVKEAALLADRVVVIKDGEIIFDQKKVSENTEKELTEILLDNY
ncbi:MAG: ABC transporter ATP-binding protein, partial [Clostridia bacterium]|nr:ABC transporter ATP-binding protein [Clostridia bacterium]